MQLSIIEVEYPEPASIGDFVWEDLDHDGIQDTDEPGIAGATATLYACDPDTGDIVGDPLGTYTTLADGFYEFTDLEPGNYKVVFELPNGYTFTLRQADGSTETNDSDGVVSDCIELSAGEYNGTIDAGGYQPASIGDFIWEDLTVKVMHRPTPPRMKAVTTALTAWYPAITTSR